MNSFPSRLDRDPLPTIIAGGDGGGAFEISRIAEFARTNDFLHLDVPNFCATFLKVADRKDLAIIFIVSCFLSSVSGRVDLSALA